MADRTLTDLAASAPGGQVAAALEATERHRRYQACCRFGTRQHLDRLPNWRSIPAPSAPWLDLPVHEQTKAGDPR